MNKCYLQTNKLFYELVGIVIFNFFIYKHLEDRHPDVQIAFKLGIGMCLAALTMCVTGVVEIVRLQDCDIKSGTRRKDKMIF